MSGREDRRGEILGLMHEALEVRMRTRRVARGVSALLVVAATVVGLRAVREGGVVDVREVRVPAVAVQTDDTNPDVVTTSHAAGAKSSRTGVKVTVVEGSAVPLGVYVNDGELEDLLREARQPVGLIRVAGNRPVVLSEVGLLASARR